MKSTKSSRSPRLKTLPEGKALGLHGMVFTQGVCRRDGDMRGPLYRRVGFALAPGGHGRRFPPSGQEKNRPPCVSQGYVRDLAAHARKAQ